MKTMFFAPASLAFLAGLALGVASPVQAQLRDPCPWTNDGDCDEPNGLNLCAPGTDVADCANPNSNFGTGSGYAGSVAGGALSGDGYSPASIRGCPNIGGQGIPGVFSGGQLQRPQRLNATAAGVAALAACNLPVDGVGYVVGNPSNSLTISAMGGQTLDLAFDGRCDATMLVRSADGRWHFNDDRDGTNPGLTLPAGQSEGRIQVWLGTYSAQGCAGQLTLRAGGQAGGGAGGAATIATWAPWHAEGNDPRSLATQPAMVQPLNAHGPITTAGSAWGLMEGIYDLYTARSGGWGQPMVDVSGPSQVMLQSNATYVVDLAYLRVNPRAQGVDRWMPTAIGAWGMYPAPGAGMAGILVHNSDVSNWRYICLLPSGAPFANCENYDRVNGGRLIPGDPGGPGITPYVPPAQRSTIRVIAGTYGGNCGAPRGNVTEHLSRQCDGQQSCMYVVDYTVIGDPVYGCAKDYVAEYTCGDGAVRSARAEPEAGYRQPVRLECSSASGG